MGFLALVPGWAKWAAIGLAILAIVLYIGSLKIEVSHYRSEAAKYENLFNDLTDRQKAKEVALQAATKAQDATRLESSAAAATEIARLQTQRVKDIHELQAKDTIIDAASRQLFNSTTTSGPDKISPPGPSNTTDATTSSTLENLLIANEENKKNYLQCAKDKSDWIQLWHETEQNLNGPSSDASGQT